jgi:hypothetical protein
MSMMNNRALLSVNGESMILDQDSYRETAKKLLIIRAPTIFRMVWAIFKHFFDAGVVQKMVFCGTSGYEKVLEEFVRGFVHPTRHSCGARPRQSYRRNAIQV